MTCAFSPLLSLLAAAMLAGSATTPSAEPPTVTLDVPPIWQTGMTVEHFHTGDEVLHLDWVKNRAIAPMTRYQGSWGPKAEDIADDHPWTIDVYNIVSRKVEDAYAHAKNGYQADLDEGEEFLLPPSDPPLAFFPGSRSARAYLFARYRRKHFRWGNAVSFFSQATQDTASYVAHNGHLTYEVWGITKDHQHTVVGWFRVSHPKLPDWGGGLAEIRGNRQDSRDLSYEMIDAENHKDYKRLTRLRQQVERTAEAAIRKDPNTKLVENCRPTDFQPSLTAIDSLIDSLQVK